MNLTIPEIGDRYIDLRSPLNYQFCTKRTRADDQVYIWSEQGCTPLEYCKIINFDIREAIEICNCCESKEQGVAVRNLLQRMKLSLHEKQALWDELSSATKEVLS